MTNIAVKFAAAENPSNGIGAFNINLKSFIFQLITFLIVLAVFKRWVLPPILKTLDDRRQTLEKGLTQAKQTEEALQRAEEKVSEILGKAREQGDQALSEAKTQAKEIISKAESTADVQAQRIINEANERLAQERLKLHEQLKAELADLVVITTEKVIRQKLNEHEDSRLIEKSIKELVHD